MQSATSTAQGRVMTRQRDTHDDGDDDDATARRHDGPDETDDGTGGAVTPVMKKSPSPEFVITPLGILVVEDLEATQGGIDQELTDLEKARERRERLGRGPGNRGPKN
jgi:hypothetical protein